MDVSEPRRIVVEIDELVLEGVRVADRDLLAATFRRELVRLLERRDVGGGLLAGPDDREHDLVSGLPPLPATASPRALGTALARAVHAGLTGAEDV